MVFGQESNVPYRLLTYSYDYEIRGDFLLASMPKAAKQRVPTIEKISR